MSIIPMIIPSALGYGWYHLSRTNYLFGARVFVNFPMQHIQTLKYLFLNFHNRFIIFPIALQFSMQASHRYRLLPASSSIRLYLIISHVDMETYDLLLRALISLGIFHNSIPHIITKVVFMYLQFYKKCACTNYC
jgi:hypothetical protein